jgi:psiF repeat-containing protein
LRAGARFSSRRLRALEEIPAMIKRALVFAFATAFLAAATAAPTVAVAAAAKKEQKEEKKEEKKALTPQQQKMKDCAGKWGEEKKKKNVKGRKAYNEFMSGCLKG